MRRGRTAPKKSKAGGSGMNKVRKEERGEREEGTERKDGGGRDCRRRSIRTLRRLWRRDC